MTFDELLQYYVDNGFMTPAQRDEITADKIEFENQRTTITSAYFGRAVAMANSTLYVGDTADQAIAQVPSGMLWYAEYPVGLLG